MSDQIYEAQALEIAKIAADLKSVKNENQKLRKLVMILHDCDMKYNCDECTEITGGSGCDRLIRELEIEV